MRGSYEACGLVGGVHRVVGWGRVSMVTLEKIHSWKVSDYDRWSWEWWKDVWAYVFIGWYRRILQWKHRADYGWAPRDTWNLDWYLAGVLGQSLQHMAETTTGYPPDFVEPFVNLDPKRVPEMAMTEWRCQLRQWSAAFLDYYRADVVEMDVDRTNRCREALRGMAKYWEYLWD